MKKSVLVVALAAFLVLGLNTAFAGGIPAAVSKAFEQKFPGATKVEWEKEANSYEAEFVWNGKEYEAEFDKSGKWLSTEQELDLKAVPQAVILELRKSEYGSWEVLEIEEEETATDKNYEFKVSKGGVKKEILIKSNGWIVFPK